jgi:hypothetical protein
MPRECDVIALAICAGWWLSPIAPRHGALRNCGQPTVSPEQGMEEFTRQRAVDSYRIVDSLPDAAYDDIVRLATMLCGTPMALVSLIDRERQWFKASIGLDEQQTRRDEAFCNHAIAHPDRLMEIPDARADARFADNPMVTGGPGIRFYAGMPLVSPDGAAIGTVCVIDREPRNLDDAQRAALASLARLTMNLLDARHRELDLERAAALVPHPQPLPTVTTHSSESGPPFRVALFQVQDYAGAVARMGERGVERALQQLDHAIESALHRERGDCANRASGSPEVVTLLHGPQAGDALRKLLDALPAFEQQHGLQVLSAHADAKAANESPMSVFMRADEALSVARSA